ncbi:MAG: helix-turn-helix domain-containing protein [Pseudonocardiaceae bacterium]
MTPQPDAESLMVMALRWGRYTNSATIRDLVAQTGRSYGWVRTLLLEAGVDTHGGDRTRGRHG